MESSRTAWQCLGIVTFAALVSIAIAGPATGRSPGPRDSGVAPWAVHLQAVDDALTQRNLGAAKRAWDEAHVAALGSWRWEGLVEIADAALRMGEVAGARHASEARARNLYLAALARARQQGSIEGVLRVAEAFAGLGDRAGVAQCLRVARWLAAQDPEAQADVRAVAARLADELVPAGELQP